MVLGLFAHSEFGLIGLGMSGFVMLSGSLGVWEFRLGVVVYFRLFLAV